MKHQPRMNLHSDVPEAVDQPQPAFLEILPSLTLEEARDFLLDAAIERAPVADDERVLGVISLDDLDEAIALGADPEQEASSLFGRPTRYAVPTASSDRRPSRPRPSDRRTPLSPPRSTSRNGTLRVTIAEIIGNATETHNATETQEERGHVASPAGAKLHPR